MAEWKNCTLLSTFSGKTPFPHEQSLTGRPWSSRITDTRLKMNHKLPTFNSGHNRRSSLFQIDLNSFPKTCKIHLIFNLQGFTSLFILRTYTRRHTHAPKCQLHCLTSKVLNYCGWLFGCIFIIRRASSIMRFISNWKSTYQLLRFLVPTPVVCITHVSVALIMGILPQASPTSPSHISLAIPFTLLIALRGILVIRSYAATDQQMPIPGLIGDA